MNCDVHIRGSQANQMVLWARYALVHMQGAGNENGKSLLAVPQLNGFRRILKDSERARLEFFVYTIQDYTSINQY